MRPNLLFKLAFPLLAALGLGGWVLFLHGHDATALALERVRAEPELVEALGEPVELGLFTLGKYSSGDLSLTLPVSGPRASGKVLAAASDEGGTWKLLRLTVSVDGQPSRSLSPEAPAATP